MNSFEKPGPSGPGRFSFITLGCKSNQYDSAAMAAQLEGAGMVRGDVGGSDVIVINTCMVTGPTESQCRKAIRQARRANQKARLVVAGCMSAGSKGQIEAMAEVDHVIEPGEKGSLPSLLGLKVSSGWSDWPADPAVDLGSRDRGFLKVQDGCNAACSYCIVPLVRGRSRSLAPREVLAAVRRIMERGACEVVLSGIHLGQYGADLKPARSLEDLLEALLDSGLPGRLRLSSIEPLEITPRLVDLLAGGGGKICRHLHIPLQSGSDRILKAMNRPYGRSHFVDAVDRLRGSITGVGIGCDVICGFPGESEQDFRKTLDVVRDMQVPFVHAFPFSPRPGTAAGEMKNDVPHRVKKERVLLVRQAARENRSLFAGTFVGQAVEVALESRSDDRGRTLGLADNYLRVAVDGAAPQWSSHDIILMKIDGLEGDVLTGYPAGDVTVE